MKKYFEILSSCSLFQGVSQAEIEAMLACLGGKVVETIKDSPIFLEGEPARFMGVVLSGAVQIVRDDYYGARSVLTVARPGELFAEAFASAGLDTMPVSVVALQSGSVMLLDCRRVLHGCTNACLFHARVIQNLLQGIARKNLRLTQKIRHMAPKTTRDKLITFLMDQAKEAGSAEFTIPYDRQALADYLGVERSAMSAEISKLRKAGILKTTGSHFTLLMQNMETP